MKILFTPRVWLPLMISAVLPLISFSQTTDVEASRFLSQATLGADIETINEVAQMGIHDWILQQYQQPVYPIRPMVESLIGDNEDLFTQQYMFRYALSDYFLSKPDLLRQRVVLALSEIFVISDRTAPIRRSPIGMADWHDMLARNAFGNFRDLIEEITYHPIMGFYLSHAANRKADPETGRFPDENYARELMQLFTIGLFELNKNGTPRLDANGEAIPTYTNTETASYARVFTGIIYDYDGVLSTRNGLRNRTADQLYEVIIDRNIRYFLSPMQTVDSQHDMDAKVLLNGVTLPAGQTTEQDVDGALDSLFNHPNVGPFIGHLLIQRLTKSNPSPDYVERVAHAFEDNGHGVRGDMMAVIYAVLMDPEVRTVVDGPAEGKMREPWVRMMNLLKAFNATNLDGTYWDVGTELNSLQQRPYSSPSVFNFFSPFFAPKGPVTDAGLRAPEFQITTTQTVPDTINFFADIIYYEMGIDNIRRRIENRNRVNDPYNAVISKPWLMDLDDERAIAAISDEALVNHLNLILTAGRLKTQAREKILNSIAPIQDPDLKVRLALYLFTLSPDFVIQR